MTQTFNPNRRRFLRDAGFLGLSVAVSGIATPYIAKAAATQLRIASNPGLENATLNVLMDQLGFFTRFGVSPLIVESNGPAGPFDSIVAGAADICLVSGYNMVLPRIEQGAKLKIIGAGMRKVALTVFARPDGIRKLADLEGKTVAVGPTMGLLHALMLQLLKERGVDSSQVNFVDKGSNDQCYSAVVNGEADACCSSISHLNDKDELVVINEGNMWDALPKCTFQAAYASDSAIREKHEEMVAVMAAYGALYDYLMSPESHGVFIEARKRIQKKFDANSAQSIWHFNQVQRPYSKNLSLNNDDIGYLQDMFIGFGRLKHKQPFTAVADMSAANAAAKLLG